MEYRTFHYKDSMTAIWTALEFQNGAVWIRIEECDSDFENVEENGYMYTNMRECLSDMRKYYGRLKPFLPD